MRRICLFAGYDEKLIVHKYVIHYVKMLSYISDVYYFADCNMSENELQKLDDITVASYASRHGKYDFGSWQELINKIGWDKLSEYDELILVNDSCFGPFRSLEPFFIEMNVKKYDFWGMTKNNEIKPHLQSYFMVFNKNVFSSIDFRDFFGKIRKEESWWDVVIKYELELTRYLENLGYCYGFFFEMEINPTFFYRTLIRKNIPLLKIKVLKEKNYARENPAFWKRAIKKTSDYDITIIKDYLKVYNIRINEISYCYLKNRIRIKLKKFKNLVFIT